MREKKIKSRDWPDRMTMEQDETERNGYGRVGEGRSELCLPQANKERASERKLGC